MSSNPSAASSQWRRLTTFLSLFFCRQHVELNLNGGNFFNKSTFSEETKGKERVKMVDIPISTLNNYVQSLRFCLCVCFRKLGTWGGDSIFINFLTVWRGREMDRFHNECRIVLTRCRMSFFSRASSASIGCSAPLENWNEIMKRSWQNRTERIGRRRNGRKDVMKSWRGGKWF